MTDRIKGLLDIVETGATEALRKANEGGRLEDPLVEVILGVCEKIGVGPLDENKRGLHQFLGRQPH